MKHTPEPWSVAEESFDNDGIHESVIRGLDGRAAIAVTLEFGENNPGMREANARRIVACVNACAGASIESLEEVALHAHPHSAVIAVRCIYAERERDELLAALKQISQWHGEDRFDALIAKMEASNAE